MNHSNFQTIIVGVDFSNYSKIVVKQAVQLAKVHEAQLVFVHAMNNTSIMSGQLPFLDLENELIKPLTQEVISFYKVKELAPDSKVIVKFGRANETILSVAVNHKSPLIIVGHKGKSTLMGRFFVGSIAEQLALHSTFPVWIHRGNTVRVLKKILLPCDFSHRTTDSFETVQCLSGSSKSNYEFFHVQQQPIPVLDADKWKKTIKELKQKENDQQKRFQLRYPQIPIKSRAGEPAPMIVKESRSFDLIAMAPHNREGIFSGFGSVTAKVVRSGNTPILITH